MTFIRSRIKYKQKQNKKNKIKTHFSFVVEDRSLNTPTHYKDNKEKIFRLFKKKTEL
jgi:hypothetical protein